MSKKIINRRSIIKLSALGVASATFQGPVQYLIQSVLNGMINDAVAKDQGLNPRSHLFIQLPGAPPRWTWDPLVPYESISNMNSNVQVGTSFINGGKSIAYKTININGVNMPWLWQFDVASSGGGMRPISELMNDLLIMRGVNAGNAAHSAARQLQVQPSGMPTSLMALNADIGTTPIPHINMNTYDINYYSKSGLGATTLRVGSNDQPLSTLLSPFQNRLSGDLMSKRNSIDKELKQVMNSLGDIAIQRNPGAKEIILSQKDAEELIRRGFNDMAKIYKDLQSKYKDIVLRSKTRNYKMAGINDAPVYGLYYGSKNEDLRSRCENNKMEMIEQFAVSEYVLKNKLSSSIAFGARGIMAQDNGFDEHTFDPLTSVYFNTLFNRCLGACVLELKDQLTSKNLWKETVVNISGEFGRRPSHQPGQKFHNFGSDHCPEAGSITLISGCLKGPEIIGNILKETSTVSDYIHSRGTCGYQASNGGEFGLLTSAHYANTIATILRVPKPLTAGKSLVKEENGSVSSIMPKAKIV